MQQLSGRCGGSNAFMRRERRAPCSSRKQLCSPLRAVAQEQAAPAAPVTQERLDAQVGESRGVLGCAQALLRQPRTDAVHAMNPHFHSHCAQVAVVLGTQWGDEGKGKLVDILAGQYEVVARAQVGCTNVQGGRPVGAQPVSVSA